MNKRTLFLTEVFNLLNKDSQYAVLRNYEELPHSIKGRDIDILITRKSFFSIYNSLVDLFKIHKIRIVQHYKLERETFICEISDNGTYELIGFDFLFNCEVKGLLLIDADNILGKRIFNGTVFHVNREYEFLVKYLYNHLLGCPYPEKYSQLMESMKENSFVQQEIKRIFGLTFVVFDKSKASSLYRNKLISNLLKIPACQSLHLFRFIYLKILCHFYCSGMSIGFTGPDGSGKTTVIEIVKKIFTQATRVDIFHFRPTLLLNMSELGNTIGLRNKIDKDYSSPHRGGRVGKLNSLIRLLYYTFDYILGYIFKIRPLITRSSVIIFDRYYTDVISDSRRSRIFLSKGFLYIFSQLFIPRLNYNILLTADPEIILARKQELNREGIDIINSNLSFLSSKKGYYLVCNNGRPEEAAQEILEIVFEKQHIKNMKRISKCIKNG